MNAPAPIIIPCEGCASIDRFAVATHFYDQATWCEVTSASDEIIPLCDACAKEVNEPIPASVVDFGTTEPEPDRPFELQTYDPVSGSWISRDRFPTAAAFVNHSEGLLIGTRFQVVDVRATDASRVVWRDTVRA